MGELPLSPPSTAASTPWGDTTGEGVRVWRGGVTGEGKGGSRGGGERV